MEWDLLVELFKRRDRSLYMQGQYMGALKMYYASLKAAESYTSIEARLEAAS